MTAFLTWYSDHGYGVKEGEGESVAAPRLESDDAEAWNFYCHNATAFVEEFGLMPGLIEGLGLCGVAKDIFLARLSRIHSTVLTMRSREVERASSTMKSDTMVAMDPT